MRTHVNSQGKKRQEKSSVLSLFLKVGRKGAEVTLVTLGGRLFQARATATGNARQLGTLGHQPSSLVHGTSSAAVDLDLSLQRKSASAMR